MPQMRRTHEYFGPQTEQPIFTPDSWPSAALCLANVGPLGEITEHLGYKFTQTIDTTAQVITQTMDYVDGEEFIERANTLPPSKLYAGGPNEYTAPHLRPYNGHYKAADFITALGEDNEWLFDTSDLMDGHDVAAHGLATVLWAARSHRDLAVRSINALATPDPIIRKQAMGAILRDIDDTVRNPILYRLLAGFPFQQSENPFAKLVNRSGFDADIYLEDLWQRSYDVAGALNPNLILPEVAIWDFETRQAVDETHLVLRRGWPKTLTQYKSAMARENRAA